MNDEIKPETMTEIFGEPIHTYTRQEALADGFQVAAPRELARQAGILWPVFLTREVWTKFVEIPAGVEGQDETGRLWDILWMLRCAIKRAPVGGDPTHMLFTVMVRNDNRRPRMVTLKSQCGPLDCDDPQPAITIMLPEQD